MTNKASDPERSRSWPQYTKGQISWNSWRCY